MAASDWVNVPDAGLPASVDVAPRLRLSSRDSPAMRAAIIARWLSTNFGKLQPQFGRPAVLHNLAHVCVGRAISLIGQFKCQLPAAEGRRKRPEAPRGRFSQKRQSTLCLGLRNEPFAS